jgi:hypothetical protein
MLDSAKAVEIGLPFRYRSPQFEMYVRFTVM